ncbi:MULTISPECIES: DUF5134 domain-containing protein [unclassified Streptomyces]|uniref:DUF5134 domain-containing protein n=1 Tax=unclassified Streptomyces TaxID=2593676 RepID=UPI000F44EFFE|nr:DUF5134 domain-containing protein [Streptomyces sp. I6]RNL73317.1 DUF5134 domain-containing protein [Streptomyces sp. I6]
MIAGNGLRWILTAVFAVPVMYGTWRACAPGSAVGDRVDQVFHVVAGALMIAMVWPWGTELPAGPQVAVLVAGAVWFLGSAPLRAATGARATASAAALPHVVMMAAMTWMVAVMGTAASGHGGGVHAPAGAHVPGASGATLMRLAGAGPRLAAVLLAVLLVALGLRWLARAFDRMAFVPRGAPTPVGGEGAPAHACHAAMALGMAEMFVLLV